MKAQVLGVKRMSGIAKESGNEFDMASLTIILPIEEVNTKKIRVSGFGYEVAEMVLEPEAVQKFAGFKFPCALDLEVELVNYRGKATQIVTGTSTPVPVRSASNG